MVESITQDDLHSLAIGAGILGTGGGGNPRNGRLRLRSIFEDSTYGDAVEVVDPADLDDDAVVTSVGGIGAPTIGVERLSKGDEEYRSLQAIEDLSGEDFDALIAGEIGGANSMAPFVVGALADLPVIDADGMGRAFPELQMATFFIYGGDTNYAALTDIRGNQVLYRNIDSAKRLENLARQDTVEMGGGAGFAFPLMDGTHVKDSAIWNTVSLAYELGEGVQKARDANVDPVERVCEITDGTILFEGKVVDVFRRNREGFAMGELELAELNGSDSLQIEFQNEYLIARDSNDEVLATVPDLICLVDKNTAEPITTDSLRYGQRVNVVGIPAPERLTSDVALEVIGPEAFGYDVDYQPL